MTLSDIKAEIRNQNYTAAIQLMETFPEKERTAEFYLLRGVCIQCPNKSNLSISEAEYSLRKAVELDPKNREAKLELAYFLLNILKDLPAAKNYFQEVLQATHDEIPPSLSSFLESSQGLRETNFSFINSLKLQTEAFLSKQENK